MHWTKHHCQKTPWAHHDGMVQLLGTGKVCFNGKKTCTWHCTFVNKDNFLLPTHTQSRAFSRKDPEQAKVNFSSVCNNSWSQRMSLSLAILASGNTKIPGSGLWRAFGMRQNTSSKCSGQYLQLYMGRAGEFMQVPPKVLIVKALDVKENCLTNHSETGKENFVLSCTADCLGFAPCFPFEGIKGREKKGRKKKTVSF